MPYLLPTIINPPGRVCIPILVPDNPEHLQVFWGHLELLSRWYSWDRDDLHLGRDVAAVYRTIWNDARAAWIAGGCETMALYDLRQLGIRIERQNVKDGDWALLYDPSAFVILKSPPTPLHNVINAPSGYRGLGINQAGNQYGLTVFQQGQAGQPVFVETANVLNTETVMTLSRAAATGSFLSAGLTNETPRPVINRYGQAIARVYQIGLPAADVHTLGAVIQLENSDDEQVRPNGLYIGSRDSGGNYYWSAIAPKGGANLQLFPVEWYEGIEISEEYPNSDSFYVSFPKQQFLDIETVNINNVAAGEPFAVRFVAPNPPGQPGGLNPVWYRRLEFDIPAAAVPPPSDAIDRVQGGGVILPPRGQTKQYTLIVMADSGTMLPFALPDGYYMIVDEVTGLWSVALPNSLPPEEIVTDADGLNIGGFQLGLLQYAIRPAGAWANEWDYVPYDTVFAFGLGERHIKFAQRRSDPVEYGTGYLAVKYTIASPEPPPEYFARAGEFVNCIVSTPEYLGNNRWKIVAGQRVIDEDSYGEVAIWCEVAVDPTTVERCWTASNVDFQLWQAAPPHNTRVDCPSGPSHFDTTDVGAMFMEGSDPMIRFRVAFTGTTTVVEFDLTGIPF